MRELLKRYSQLQVLPKTRGHTSISKPGQAHLSLTILTPSLKLLLSILSVTSLLELTEDPVAMIRVCPIHTYTYLPLSLSTQQPEVLLSRWLLSAHIFSCHYRPACRLVLDIAQFLIYCVQFTCAATWHFSAPTLESVPTNNSLALVPHQLAHATASHCAVPAH